MIQNDTVHQLSGQFSEALSIWADARSGLVHLDFSEVHLANFLTLPILRGWISMVAQREIDDNHLLNLNKHAVLFLPRQRMFVQDRDSADLLLSFLHSDVLQSLPRPHDALVPACCFVRALIGHGGSHKTHRRKPTVSSRSTCPMSPESQSEEWPARVSNTFTTSWKPEKWVKER